MVLAFAVTALLAVQDTVRPAPADSQAQGALRLFLDCPNGGCDTDYLRTEIRFVNYVRDRTVADVHTLVTRQQTGSGEELTLAFIGLRAFAGLNDTLRFTTSSTDTQDERRQALARVLRLGLMRYVARTPLASRIGIQYQAGDDEERESRTRQGRDPWNFWVFEISANADLSGEESSSDRGLNASIEAQRVTEQWKWQFELDGNSRRSKFELDDTTTFVSERTSWSFDALMVRSAGPRWSVGALAEARHESFRNLDFQVTAAPAVEYNIYPYAQSTRRSLTFRYAAGLEHSRYQDTTIYDKLSETNPVHGLEIEFEARQPWGSAYASIDSRQYLHDLSKVNLEFYASGNIRLIRGLSLNFYGGYSVIRSQLYLSKVGATPEEIIARQQALATNYSYFTGFGLSYTFGSIYNNVVNPRM